MQSFRHIFAFVFLSICCSLAWGQTSSTSLRGTVTDPSGAVVPGSQVAIENAATGFRATQVSNASGEYQFQQLQPGTYTITATETGFGSQSKKAELLVNQPATVNFKLTVETMATTVDVSAEAQTLNTADATIGNSVNNATIEALPMEGRNVPDLLSLQPGVLYLGRGIDQTNDSRSGAVSGARSDQSNVTLDGLDDNDQNNGFPFNGVLRSTLDSVEEFRVTTSNSNADAGRSSGGQVSMVTKSGTNHFHGAAYEYNRNSLGLANDWFNKQAQLASGLPNRPGKLIRNTFGGDAGGPIMKDKLFFFGNYEGQRTAENKQVTQISPTSSFLAGNITYLSNGSPVTLNSGQVAAMDAGCSANGTCPWGPGVDPNILAVMNQYFPPANGASQGDGYNLGSYTFSSPYPGSLNTSIAKFDWLPSGKHHLFARGNLQKDNQAGILQFPGQPPSTFLKDNSKGLAGGDTWSITNNLVNDLRYGYIRQGYSNRGAGQGDYITFRFVADPVAETRSTIVNVPIHNIVDNLSWTKGNHNLQFGVNWRLIHNNRQTDANSYSFGDTNEYWLANSGSIAGTGGSLDPAAFGNPAVDDGFANSYNIAIALLTGLVPESTGQYNFQVSKDGLGGALLPDGTLINRHYKANEFEYYIQDSWRARPNLTLTFGLRHTILQTPYETNGQQIAPTVDTHQWFLQRGAAAAQGQTYEPELNFAPSGQARGLKGYWPMNWKNIAPRLAFAYSPSPKTSIRAGFGIYYDHYGEGIVNSFDQLGSYGLTTSIETPASTYSVDNSPRFTGLQALPTPLPGAGTTAVSYPYAPPDLFAITWGIDSHLKTPYSLALDFSVQQQLPGGFLLEAAYVGRNGRHLLQELDLAEPVNLVDPKSGMDYFTAATMLSKLADQNHLDPNASVPAIPYFEDLFPDAAGVDAAGDGVAGNSATQNIYSVTWADSRGNETNALYNMDEFCDPGCGGQIGRYWQQQFSSLYAWSSIGSSSYNAAQLILRHAMSHGLQLDLSYTLSKSIDMGSDTERTNDINNGSFNQSQSNNEIQNSWNPSLNRGVSDFDTRHLITLDWVYLLPFGKGRHFAGGASRLTDALIGGWQFSGLTRWSSGLPFSIVENGWSTNWQVEAYTVTTAPVKLHKHIDANGIPQVFADQAAINNGFSTGSPIRFPYPGEAGERNNFRGDGFFGVDSGLAKTWKITENQSAKLTWEVFNVTNSARFDTSPINVSGGLNDQATSGTLGNYSSTLTVPRVMQFSLRYAF
jgi:hypothetical protein